MGATLPGPVNLPDGNGGIRWEGGTRRRVLCLPSPAPPLPPPSSLRNVNHPSSQSALGGLLTIKSLQGLERGFPPLSPLHARLGRDGSSKLLPCWHLWGLSIHRRLEVRILSVILQAPGVMGTKIWTGDRLGFLVH